MPFTAMLNTSLWGNSLRDWAIAAAIAIGATIGLGLVKRWSLVRLRRLAERTESTADDLVVSVLARTKRIFYVAVGVWLGLRHVVISDTWRHWTRVGLVLVLLWQVGAWLQIGIRQAADSWRSTRGDDAGARTVASATVFVSQLVVWSLMLVGALSTLGFEISALVAGLGVGGVAAALAVQNILGDVFSSLSIYFGRPFDLGDFIVVGAEMGTVEHIGLRTTRLRSLGGEEIVFANGDLTKSRIRNYKRMRERRILFGIGVEYATPLAELERIPQYIRTIVEAREGLRFDRAHFKEYGDYSLNFEIVYYVLSPDYSTYMDHQHAINIGIFREFQARKIQFAFPTRTLLLHPQAPWPSENSGPTDALAPNEAGNSTPQAEDRKRLGK
jgi:small-conductance mechanosensitive channel